MKSRWSLLLVVLGAGLGLLFAGFSTFDFAQHLDRQIHGVHCSFLPGFTGTQAGESGCQAVMMSPYSSLFRSNLWGGIPISLPAMSVFAFLLFFAGEIVLARRKGDRRATGFLALATVLPASVSAVMAFIAMREVGAMCKLCVGIYAASALGLLGALLLWLRARRAGGEDEWAELVRRADAPRPGEPAWVASEAGNEPPPEPQVDGRPAGAPVGAGYLCFAFVLGLVFVAVPVAAYVATAPDHSRFVAACGTLEDPGDPYRTLVPMETHTGGAPTIEVLDPLCPACRAFEVRLKAAGLSTKLDRKAALFPLDNACNWMVDRAIHPGACAVSEAILCAGARSSEVVAWAFEHQDRIREAAARDGDAARRMVTARFPELRSCLGSAEVRSRINKSLRWAVRNHLPVLTPQLYVAGVKLCDEDVDLGLDFALSRMLELFRNGALAGASLPPAPLPPAGMPVGIVDGGPARDMRPTGSMPALPSVPPPAALPPARDAATPPTPGIVVPSRTAADGSPSGPGAPADGGPSVRRTAPGRPPAPDARRPDAGATP